MEDGGWNIAHGASPISHLPSPISFRSILYSLFSILLLAQSALAAPPDTFHCRWNFVDFTTAPYRTREVTIQTIAPFGVGGDTIITGDRRTFKTSTGSLTVSNLVMGLSYRVRFVGPNLVTTITNSFPASPGLVGALVNAVDYVAAPLSAGASVAYSQNSADARFHNVSGDTSSNAVFTGRIKIPAGASVGYVLTATNADGSLAWAAATGGGGGSGATNWDFLSITNAPWANTNAPTLYNVTVKNGLTSKGSGGAASEAFGIGAQATHGSLSLAVGQYSLASGDSSTALGNYAEATNFSTIGIGPRSKAYGDSAVAIGDGAKAYGTYTVALGAFAQATNKYAIAIGHLAKAGPSNSIALGWFSQAKHDASVALGNNSETTATNQIMLGVASGTIVAPGNTVLAGGSNFVNGLSTSNLNLLHTDPGLINFSPLYRFGLMDAVFTNNAGGNFYFYGGDVSAGDADQPRRFHGIGDALTYTGTFNNGNLPTTVDTLQELNDAVDNLSLGASGSSGPVTNLSLYTSDNDPVANGAALKLLPLESRAVPGGAALMVESTPPYNAAGYKGKFRQTLSVVTNTFGDLRPNVVWNQNYNGGGNASGNSSFGLTDTNEPVWMEQRESRWQNGPGLSQFESWNGFGTPYNPSGTNTFSRWFGANLVWDTASGTYYSSDGNLTLETFNFVVPSVGADPGNGLPAIALSKFRTNSLDMTFKQESSLSFIGNKNIIDVATGNGTPQIHAPVGGTLLGWGTNLTTAGTAGLYIGGDNTYNRGNFRITPGQKIALRLIDNYQYLQGDAGGSDMTLGTYSAFIFNNLTTAAGAGTERMRLNTTGLGIGTNSPAEKLDVNGRVRAVGGYLVNSNSYSTIPTLAEGQNWYFSSNAIPHVRYRLGGADTTVRLVP